MDKTQTEFYARRRELVAITPHFEIIEVADGTVWATVSIPGVNLPSEALAHFYALGDGVTPTLIDGVYADLGRFTPVRLR